MNGWHRIHTTRQAKVCRQVAEVRVWRQREQAMREQAWAAADAATAAAQQLARQSEIIQAVLNMDTVAEGTTEGIPVIKPGQSLVITHNKGDVEKVEVVNTGETPIQGNPIVIRKPKLKEQ